jgi:hypothetical protein
MGTPSPLPVSPSQAGTHTASGKIDGPWTNLNLLSSLRLPGRMNLEAANESQAREAAARPFVPVIQVQVCSPIQVASDRDTVTE